jgi:hypothetical protein
VIYKSIGANDRARATVAVGIGYCATLQAWTRASLDRLDVLEITVDDCIGSSDAQTWAIFDLVGRIPLTAPPE